MNQSIKHLSDSYLLEQVKEKGICPFARELGINQATLRSRINTIKGRKKETGPRFAVSDESFCLAFFAESPKSGRICGSSMKVMKRRYTLEYHKVRGICGGSVREMLRGKAETLNGGEEVLADTVTGSFYDPKTGQCHTGNLKIVEWHV